jgi:signal transduction histidine kinase
MEELDREELNEAIKSIQFMNKIIEDLALLSMLEGSIEFEKIDLIDDLEIVEEFLQKIAEKKKIEIKVKTNTKELYYSANQALFRRAVMNLVENAIKYSPKGSKVILELEKLENKVVIKIIDQGNGISEVEKEKIFERFYREDRSRSRDSGGSGLGLSIAQKIVSLHGGELKLESKESEGSTFFIVLPT